MWEADSLEELTERDMGKDMSPDVAVRLRQYQADFKADANVTFSEVWTLYPRDTPHTMQMFFASFELDDGRMATLIEAVQDYELPPETLRSSEALLHTPVMITLYDTSGTALYRNPAARTALPDACDTFAERFLDASMHALIISDLNEAGVANETALVRTSDGERWHDISARLSHDAVTGKVAWLVSEVDVNGLKETEERAHYLAGHDALTGLPNRHNLHATFSERLLEIKSRGEQGAVIFIDLDHFKHINDTLGHAAGDRLLMVVASRLRNMIRQADLVARLGGDEFLVLVSSKNIVEHVQDLAGRIAESLSQPLRLHGRDARITPTLGVSLFPTDGNDMETLMRHADLAVYSAKDKGRNTMVFFSPEMNAAVQSRVTLESEIRVGLELGQFEVHYQPRVRVADNVIMGAEALARWRHPEHGMVPPDDFIPVCEDTGLILELGATILQQAAHQQRVWHDAGHDIVVSVNLSAVQVSADNFVDTVLNAAVATGADPRFIELEITESMVLGDDQETITRLHALAEHGFKIAIDDFGTGYSNLAYLHRYPLGCLKIDRSFISAPDDARPIAELILSMAKLLDMDIVAEGVETASQLAWLNDSQCHQYQGFLYSAAVSALEFDTLLATPSAPGAIP